MYLSMWVTCLNHAVWTLKQSLLLLQLQLQPTALYLTRTRIKRKVRLGSVGICFISVSLSPFWSAVTDIYFVGAGSSLGSGDLGIFANQIRSRDSNVSNRELLFLSLLQLLGFFIHTDDYQTRLQASYPSWHFCILLDLCCALALHFLFHLQISLLSVAHFALLFFCCMCGLWLVLAGWLGLDELCPEEFVAHASSVNCLKIGRKSSRVLVTGGEDHKVNLWAIGKPNAILVRSPPFSSSFFSCALIISIVFLVRASCSLSHLKIIF